MRACISAYLSGISVFFLFVFEEKRRGQYGRFPSYDTYSLYSLMVISIKKRPDERPTELKINKSSLTNEKKNRKLRNAHFKPCGNDLSLDVNIRSAIR